MTYPSTILNLWSWEDTAVDFGHLTGYSDTKHLQVRVHVEVCLAYLHDNRQTRPQPPSEKQKSSTTFLLLLLLLTKTTTHNATQNKRSMCDSSMLTISSKKEIFPAPENSKPIQCKSTMPVLISKSYCTFFQMQTLFNKFYFSNKSISRQNYLLWKSLQKDNNN